MKEVINEAFNLKKSDNSEIAEIILSIVAGKELTLEEKAKLYNHFKPVKEVKNPMRALVKFKGNNIKNYIIYDNTIYATNGHVMMFKYAKMEDGYYDVNFNKVDNPERKIGIEALEKLSTIPESLELFDFHEIAYFQNNEPRYQNIATFINKNKQQPMMNGLDKAINVGMDVSYYELLGKPKKVKYDHNSGMFYGNINSIVWMVMGIRM